MPIGSDDFAYINARVRSLRGFLLQETVYGQILKSEHLTGIREILSRTVYEKELSPLGEEDIDGQLEQAVSREWTKTASKVLAFSDGLPRTFLEIILGFWDVENLKTLFRGKKANLPAGDILRVLVPAGRLTLPQFGELVRQPGFSEVISLLDRWMIPEAKTLRRALSAGEAFSRDSKALPSLELALNREYFKTASSRLDPWGPEADPVWKFLGALADRFNLMTALKISSGKSGLENHPEDHFLDGRGKISLKYFLSLGQMKSREEIRLALLTTPLGFVGSYLGEGSSGLFPLLGLERALDRHLLQGMRKVAVSDPLGIGLSLGFLIEKHQEAVNLGLLIRGKPYRFYPDNLRELLAI